MSFDPAEIDLSYLFQDEIEDDEVENTEGELLELFDQAVFEDAKSGLFETEFSVSMDEEELGELESVCEEYRNRGFVVEKLVKEIDGRMITQNVLISWEEAAKKAMEELNISSDETSDEIETSEISDEE